MAGLYGLRCIQKASDIVPVTRKIIQRVQTLRDALLKSEEALPDVLDDISYTMCSLIDPLECVTKTHRSPRYREAAFESISMLHPLMIQLNTDNAIPEYITTTLERFKFRDERLSILKYSLAEYQNYGVGNSNPEKIAKLHSIIHKLALQFSESLYNMNQNARQQALLRLLNARYELAKSLGHSSYTIMYLKDKVLASPNAVEQFLHFKLKQGKPVSNCNMSFPHSAVSEEWNSLQSVCHQVVALAGEIYGIEASHFVELADGNTKIVIHDRLSGKLMGIIYADLKQRIQKQIEPSHFTILGSKKLVRDCLVTGINDSSQRPTVYISCNIIDHCQVSFDEIASIFHEFGHAYHAIMSDTDFQMLSGTRCALDFAEVPSILFEKLASQWNTMKAMGCPESARPSFELWREQRANKRSIMEHLKLSFADQSIHGYCPPKNVNDLKLVCRKAEELVGTPSEDNEWLSSVGHLSNYGSCYYSYMLADTIAEKILKIMQDEKSFGLKLRHKLFSKGGTVSPLEQLNYLGINI